MAATIGISAPYLLASLCILMLDVFSAAYYSVDYTLSSVSLISYHFYLFLIHVKIIQSVGGTMTVMNITNRDEMLPILSQIAPNVRTFPSAVMMYISLKFFVFLALNMVLIISIFPCVWDSINENKRTKMKSDRVYILSNSLTGNEDRELDLNE
jgi:hypothetical protein